MAQVVVIVVTHNSADCIADLLRSIREAGVDGEVVVVDNGSLDDSATIAEQGGARVICNTNVGYAGGINRGVREAPDADAYVILNPDLTVAPGFLDPLLGALGEPGVGIVVPQVLDDAGHRQNSLRREPSLARAIGLNWTGIPLFSEYVTGDEVYARPADVDWALGAAMAVSRSCLEAVGPWDESFFLYSEETDFCLRARDAGWRVRYVPESLVTHIGGGSGRSALTHQMLIVNKVRLYARRHGRAASWAYWLATIASEASWVVRGEHQSRAAIRSLVQPAARPPQLGLGSRLLPR